MTDFEPGRLLRLYQIAHQWPPRSQSALAASWLALGVILWADVLWRCRRQQRAGSADTAYGTGKLLAWLLGKGIAPHIPVWERYQRTDGMFPRTDFAYDAERDVYICANDRILRTSGTVHDGRVRNDCDVTVYNHVHPRF